MQLRIGRLHIRQVDQHPALWTEPSASGVTAGDHSGRGVICGGGEIGLGRFGQVEGQPEHAAHQCRAGSWEAGAVSRPGRQREVFLVRTVQDERQFFMGWIPCRPVCFGDPLRGTFGLVRIPDVRAADIHALRLRDPQQAILCPGWVALGGYWGCC